MRGTRIEEEVEICTTNGYLQGFIDSVINSRGSSRLNKEQKPLGSIYILVPLMCVFYHNFCCIFSCYLPSNEPGLR
jgi:hypothetical protein